MTIDAGLWDLPTVAHNKAGKEALGEELEEHHKRRIPGHFKQTARGKYHYKERSPIYKAIKKRKYHSITDLVRKGDTERMARSQHQVRIGGTVTGTFRQSGEPRSAPGLTGSLIMWVPWSANQRDSTSPRAVRTHDMANEITAVTPEEEGNIAYGFGRRYLQRLRFYSAAGSRRARIYGAKK
jgi:hypothetical protein